MNVTNGLTPIARSILALVAARPDLQKDDGSPSTSAIARATQHQQYQLSQPTVSRILRGEITDPSTTAVRALAELFRVSEATIRGNETFAQPTSSTAQALAQRFGQLPDEAQQYLLAQVDAMLEFGKAAPKLAKFGLSVPAKKK